MSTARTHTHAAFACAALLVCIFAASLACMVGAKAAYADFVSSGLATQEDSKESTEPVIPTQLATSMVTLVDLKPTETTSGLTVTLANGDKALTSGTHYTYTSPSKTADSEDGKTVTLTGKDTYAGKITIWYKVEVTGSNFAANFAQVRYNATDGFKVSLGPAGQNYKSSITVPAASKLLEGSLTMNGTGSYASDSIKVSYKIARQKEIRESMVSVVPTADGKSLAISVSDGTNTLKKDADYTLADLGPSGADDNGEPLHVCVEGIGDWSGTVEYYCVIEDVDEEDDSSLYTVVKVTYLPDCTAELSEKTFLYDGKAHKPSGITVKDGTTVLVEGADYEVTWPAADTIEKGSYPVTVKGLGSYRGVLDVFYNINEKSDNLEIVLADTHKSFVYTGNSRQPTFSAYSSTSYSRVITQVVAEDGTKSEKILTKDTDYEVEFWPSTTVNAGTYTITVTGKGDYADAGSVQATYEITPAELKVSYSYFSGYNSYPNTFYYTGAEVEPTLSSLTVSGVSGSLVKDTDYEVEYLNNVDVAASDAEDAPTMVLKAKDGGNFTGKDYVTFTIGACPLSTSYIEYEYDSSTYTGKVQTPAPKTVKVKSSGVALVKNKDYVVDDDKFANNTDVGTATSGIMAIGSNFSGSMSTSFKIEAKSINGSGVSVSSVSSQTYTGSAITPAITIKDSKAGKTLTQLDSAYISLYQYYAGLGSTSYDPSGKSSDFYVEFSSNTNPGTAKAKITGMRNYTGSRTISFKINATGTVPKVKATNQGGGVVLLKWNPIYNATKYRVLEKNTNGTYKTLSNNVTSTACRVSNLSSTRNHRFLVQAYVNKKWSSNSDVNLVSCKPTGATKPTIRAQSYSDTAILVSWNQVPGASAYALYEKVGKKYQLRSDSYKYTSVRFTSLKKKKSYTYCVRAKIDGKWYKVSNKVTFSPADPNSPVPTAAAVAGKKGQIKLTWGKPRNATKYMVQVLKGKSWKTLTKNCKALTYTATGLAATKQTFRVRAYGNGKWSKIYSDYYATATPDNA